MAGEKASAPTAWAEGQAAPATQVRPVLAQEPRFVPGTGRTSDPPCRHGLPYGFHVSGRESDDPDVQTQIDELRSRADAADRRADASQARADEAERRADDSEARADKAELRADDLSRHADAAVESSAAHESLAQDDRLRIANIEGRLDIHDELIAELQAEGFLSREQAENMKAALESSRLIGAAVGIIMAFHGVSETNAWELLRKASMDSNQKVRFLAEDIVRTGRFEGPQP